MKKDPYYRKIMQTSNKIIDRREATEASIHARKFLLNQLFNKGAIPKNDNEEADRCCRSTEVDCEPACYQVIKYLEIQPLKYLNSIKKIQFINPALSLFSFREKA